MHVYLGVQEHTFPVEMQNNTYADVLTRSWAGGNISAGPSLYNTFAFSLQPLRHNLQDEVMHSSVKWNLFMSLTLEVKRCTLNTLRLQPENEGILPHKKKTPWDRTWHEQGHQKISNILSLPSLSTCLAVRAACWTSFPLLLPSLCAVPWSGKLWL